jgi:flagellar protein FlaG
MLIPIQPNSKPNIQSTMIPADAFPGQKLERSQDTPRQVVDRKQETTSAREEIPREQVEKAAEKLNRLMGIIDKRLEFKVHEKSRRISVKIIDQSNGEVIDEIPPEKLMDSLDSFSEMIGLLFDKRI